MQKKDSMFSQGSNFDQYQDDFDQFGEEQINNMQQQPSSSLKIMKSSDIFERLSSKINNEIKEVLALNFD